MIKGRLKAPFNEKGFTFLIPDDEPDSNIFLHISALVAGQQSAEFVRGSIVEYEVEVEIRNGVEKPKAVTVTLPSRENDTSASTSSTGLSGSPKFWYPTGYGFLVDHASGNEYYVNSKGVPKGYLRPGDKVEFDVVRIGEKEQAVNIRVLDWKPIGDVFSDEVDMGSPDWAHTLAKLAETEKWNYQVSPSKDAYIILRSYLKYTYLRQRELPSHLVTTTNQGYMAFNTGLVTDFQEEIYALFQRSATSGPPWRLCSFERASSMVFLTQFGGAELPIAWYYDQAEQLVYDTSLPLKLSVEHVPHDPDRFPSSLAKVSPEDLAGLVDAKAPEAINRVRRNYKTAIPQFYRDGSNGAAKMQLLLPVALLRRDTVELALAVDRLDSGVYLRRTVLTLDWAYNNARLLTRPDTDWLKP